MLSSLVYYCFAALLAIMTATESHEGEPRDVTDGHGEKPGFSRQNFLE